MPRRTRGPSLGLPCLDPSSPTSASHQTKQVTCDISFPYSQRSGCGCKGAPPLQIWASLVAQTVKNLPAVWETQVRCLGHEDPLEKEMVSRSCLENPGDRGAWQVTIHGIVKSQTRLSD